MHVDTMKHFNNKYFGIIIILIGALISVYSLAPGLVVAILGIVYEIYRLHKMRTYKPKS